MKYLWFVVLFIRFHAAIATAATMLVPGGPFRTVADIPQDGAPTYIYDFVSGEFSIGGEGTGIGLIEAWSASGLFTDRGTCSGCFPIDTDHLISHVINAGGGNTLPSARIMNIGPGLPARCLMRDLTLKWSGGFGHPIQEANLALVGVPEPTAMGLAILLACPPLVRVAYGRPSR